MSRLLFMLFVVLATIGCEGTMSLGSDSDAIATSAESTISTPDGPADSPADSIAPTSTAASETPSQSAPAAEPEPEVEPDLEPPAAEEETEVEPSVEEEPEPTLPEPGSIVEFVIEQGTGNGAWNDTADPVVVYVGQVLRLTNLDDRTHQMHATDSAPFPHGGQLVPGQSQDYVVTSPLEVGSEPEMWDHGDGRNAAFWLRALEYPSP